MESFTLGLMRGDGAPLYRQLYRHIVEENPTLPAGWRRGKSCPASAAWQRTCG